MSTPMIAIEGGSATPVRLVLAGLVGGLVAGSIDIGVAALINMVDPRLILRFVAGGIQGRAALSGGMASVWLGLILQWGMSTLIAAIFVFAAVRMRSLTARWAIAGLVYGAIVFAVMNFIVMPLSAWHHVNHFSSVSLIENIVAMLLFGLIIALVTRLFVGSQIRE